MEILADHRKDVPITVTLKAETMMQLIIMATTAPQIPASEVVKMKDAITTALKI